MKNLFKLASVLLILFGIFAFGQDQKQSQENTALTRDETRLKLATVMAETKDNLSIVYSSGMTYETFRSKVLGRSGAAVTQEGEALLTKAYNYLKAGTSNNQIINSDSGIEMGQALIKADKLGNDGSGLFSTPGSSDIPKLDINFQTHQHEAKGSSLAGCKWYQLGCWIDEIFGAGASSGIMGVIIAWLKVKLTT
jgi:hypothetical protein